MSDPFFITPPTVRAEGKDVPPEQIQAALNALSQQVTLALNTLAGFPPAGPAGGDLSGTYPNPTVAAVHATSGTMSGVTITAGSVNNTPIGGTTPNSGAFTSVTSSTAIGIASGGTGSGTQAGALTNILGASTVPIANGGTNATTAANARTNLGLGTIATQNANNVAITGGTIDNAPIGGTTTAAGAFTSVTSSTAIGVASGGTGRATLTTRAVLIGEGTAAVNFAAPSTAGQALISAGAAADPVFGSPTGIYIGTQVFSVAGAITYTKSAAANNIRIRMVGGGGQGGGAATTTAGNVAPAGGGGSGAYLEAYIPAASSTAGTVGAAGSGGVAGAAGGNGGSTSITIGGVTYTAPGGGGGSAASAQNPPFFFSGGAGAAVATNGNLINAMGQSGGPGIGMAGGTNDIAGGWGGASQFGGGANLVTGATAAGNAATTRGSGGGGAISNSMGAAQAGGNGAAGLILIDEYA